MLLEIPVASDRPTRVTSRSARRRRSRGPTLLSTLVVSDERSMLLMPALVPSIGNKLAEVAGGGQVTVNHCEPANDVVVMPDNRAEITRPTASNQALQGES